MRTKAISIVTKGGAVVVAGIVMAGLAATGAMASDAKSLYKKSCVSCHGPTGKGDGPAGKFLKPPAADFATVLKGQTDADIAKIIKDGGKAVGKSPLMPAFGKKMSDDQIQGLVEYVKGISSK